MISFKVTPAEHATIVLIAKRASRKGFDRMATTMDLTAVHANGNPLRLQELPEADDFNFFHDLGGIRNHLNRETGEPEDCFLPRFSEREVQVAV